MTLPINVNEDVAVLAETTAKLNPEKRQTERATERCMLIQNHRFNYIYKLCIQTHTPESARVCRKGDVLCKQKISVLFLLLFCVFRLDKLDKCKRKARATFPFLSSHKRNTRCEYHSSLQKLERIGALRPL